VHVFTKKQFVEKGCEHSHLSHLSRLRLVGGRIDRWKQTELSPEIAETIDRDLLA
jgi:hypothetical protein